jgi:hypothetical protein
LQRLQPSEDLFELAYAMFKALWDERLNATEAEVRARKEELAKIERSVADRDRCLRAAHPRARRTVGNHRGKAVQ